MKKKNILTILIVSTASTLFGCNLNETPKNIQISNKDIKELNNSKVSVKDIDNKLNSKTLNYFNVNTYDSEDIKSYKQAYNVCYDLYKQGFILRNYVLDVEEMCFEHGKNTVYEIIYNCIYKDMDIEVPLEELKNEQIILNNKLNSLNNNANINEYIKSFKNCYDKGEYSYVQKTLLSDMSCDEFMLKSYNEKLNLAIKGQEKILNQMKKQLENMMR